MKKKLLITVLIVIICESIAITGILLYLLYSSGNHSSENVSNESMDAYRERKLNSSPFYDIKADIETEKNVIIIKENINFKKASEKLFAYVPSVNSAVTRIKNVYSGKTEYEHSLKGTVLEVKCKSAQSSITVEYEISLGNTGGMLAYDENNYFLTNFLITPVVYSNGKPVYSYKSTFGDPYIYETSNYYVLFKTDKSVSIFAPGSNEEHIFGSNKISIFQASDIRDFPAVISKNVNVDKKSYNDIDLYFVGSKDTEEYVIKILEYAQKNIGPYPYKSLFIVKAPISQKGMEFSNMVFISDRCFSNKEDLKRITYHEILHQWFYGIIGTDQLNEPFFDEGLVNYLSILLSSSGKIEDKLAKQGSSIFTNKPLSSYSSREEYYELAYNSSAAYFYNIHKKLGNNFYIMLKKLYEDRKYKILYYQEFLKYVSNYGGKQ